MVVDLCHDTPRLHRTAQPVAAWGMSYVPPFSLLTIIIALLYIALFSTGDGLNLDVAKTSRYGLNLDETRAGTDGT